jgi:hypothetical protein
MKKIFTLIFTVCFFIANSQSTCTHTFNTYDSFGDGWNGASVDINVNGVTVLSGVYGPSNGNTGQTPIPGFCDANPFQASSGDAISLSNWVSGLYDSEISWDITDVNGNIIASGGTMVNGGGFGFSGAVIAICASTSWDCDASGTCFDPGTGQGQYGSLFACQNYCTGACHTANGYTAGFEDGITSLILTPADWTQNTDDNTNGSWYGQWIWSANWSGPTPTPTLLTGPGYSTNYGGTGYAMEGAYFMFVEASGNYNNDISMTSHCFDLSTLSNASLKFWYNMFGSGMGSLDVELSSDGGITWDSTWTVSGDQGVDWAQANIDVSAYAATGVTVKITGTTGSTDYSDICIDAMSFVDAGCTHTFNMYDTNGDGWNGASVDLNVNGVTMVYGATGDSINNPGACGFETFQASSGDYITLSNWVSGQDDSEISWDIKDGNGYLIAIGGTITGGGGFGFSGAVIAICASTSWDCDASGTCFDPGTGQGQYGSLFACQSFCTPAATWNCANGMCTDPGTGQGLYSSLVACQTACAPITSLNADVPVQFMIFTDRYLNTSPTYSQLVTISTHPTNPRNYLNPGEIVRFKVGVTNKLSTNLTSALITFSSTFSDPYVTITANQNGLNNMTSYQCEFTLNEFEITIDPSCPPGHIFYADFEIVNQITNASYNNTAFPIFIQPLINVEQTTPGVTPGTMIDDDSNPDSNGDDDHIVDPNETIELTPQLQESTSGVLNLLDLFGSVVAGNIFPGPEDPLTGCLLNVNNYSYVNIWNNVPGASGANVVNCLPSSLLSNSYWNIQPILNNDYLKPGYDFVFDFNNTSTCKFDLFVEFEAPITWHQSSSWNSLATYNDEIRWLTKITINPNESPCISASWDCDISNLTCSDPGTGQGQYSTQSACVSACVSTPSWDCDISNLTCSDPGTGQGQYSTQSACVSACVSTPSWDCDISNLTCSDPGNGQGQFSTQSACVSACVSTNTSSYIINSIKIFPNPLKEKAVLEFQDKRTQSVLLFDVMGKLLREYEDISNNKLIIERGSLSTGTYILKIINENSIIMERIIVE